MSAPAHHHDLPARPAEDSDSAYEGHSRWLMLLCCALMVVAVVLIALGR